jgi:hypothetical protein
MCFNSAFNFNLGRYIKDFVYTAAAADTGVKAPARPSSFFRHDHKDDFGVGAVGVECALNIMWQLVTLEVRQCRLTLYNPS